MTTCLHPSAVVLAMAATLGGCEPGSSSDSFEGSESGRPPAGASTDDGSSSGEPAAAVGTVTLAFGVARGVRLGPTLVDPLVGPVYGGIYPSIDVTLTGPVAGVSPMLSMEVDGVDLTTADVATVTWTSEPLPAGSYTFLGMLDVDDNFAATDGGGPDPGDPITLTGQSFEVVAGQDTAFTAIFELVYG